MLLITLALAWYFYDSVEWYAHDVEQIAHSNRVLQSYQSLAKQTWRLLHDMQQAVEAGGNGFQGWQGQVNTLEQTVESLRLDLGAEAGDAAGTGGSEALARLADFEKVLTPILEAQAEVAAALQAGEANVAAAELRRLYDEGLVALFARMADAVVHDQDAAAQLSERGAISLASYITSLLPAFVAVLVGLTLLMAWLFSRRLTRSVRALHDGAMAFSAGQLSYRIPELPEQEFGRLAEEFNAMAHELSEHRVHLDEAKVRLEAMVEERTRALKLSNEKLKAIDDNRRQLLADISHEFRTPLTVIQGEAQIALRGSGKSSDDFKDTLRRILDESKQTTRLVDDLLFIARAEVGEPRLSMSETPVVEILQSLCEEFDARARVKEITIEHDFPDSGPVLFADSGRLRQVFAILLDNAIKYSRNEQTVEVALLQGDQYVTVTVSDRGIGLSAEELEHVFVRFYRSKQAEGHDTGTGLGLPVAKAIVEAHGGEISLESRRGGGVVATVRLPLDRSLEIFE